MKEKERINVQKKVYLHSPFCEKIFTQDTRFLLIEFILTDLFSSYTLCQALEEKLLFCGQTFNAFSLSSLTQSAPLDRIQEHSSLIPFAFPFKKEETEIFTHSLSNTINLFYNLSKRNTSSKTFSSQMTNYIRQMFFLLEPFMEECKNDGSFLFFLLSHHKDISLLSHSRYLLSLLKKLHPQGLPFIQEHVCDHFYKRGFAYLIPEIKSLVKLVKKG